MGRNVDNPKLNSFAKAINSKCEPPKKKTIDLSKKVFSPSKTASNNMVDIYVSGMTHGVVVMRTERSNKKNVEGFVSIFHYKVLNCSTF